MTDAINMIRLIVLSLAIGLSFTADHDTFKDCSRVEFCSKLRERTAEAKYDVDKSSINSTSQSDINLILKAKDGSSSDLKLELFFLEEGDILRLKIAEVDSERYQLSHVLDGEPNFAEYGSLAEDEGLLTIILDDILVNVYYSPFSIEVYKNEVLVVLIDGDSLVMENTETSSAFAFNVKFPEAIRMYGIHEHADSLALKNTTNPDSKSDPYRLRNLDVSGYELNSPMALYGAVPVLYGHGLSQTAGVFIHNAAEQWIDISEGDKNTMANVMVESGTLDLFVLLGPSPAEVVKQYVTLTGTAHMPQLWALGYHQCRWNYDNETDVIDVITNFDKFNFQLDVIWLDIEYTDGKKYFTWDPENFKDPIGMQNQIAETNRKLVTIIDPHIKVEPGYVVYDVGNDLDLFVKNANGTTFQGDCWPGLSSYMDFLNPVARRFYGDMYSYDYFAKTTPTLAGIWNDMNEPSVFDDSIEKTIPGDAIHKGGVRHRDIHNIYGLLHTMSTHQGLLARDQGTKRPFILTRSHFAGTQRYSAIWTGDNTADWGYLAISYAECLNANILGLVFCGADVGGFDGNPDAELLQRWYQAGAWLPFYRAHANMGTERREPYLFSEDVQKVIREAIQLRYAHLPTWYTLFYEHVRTGSPVIRPLFYHYPEDENVLDIDNQLLLGSDIMVRIVSEPGVETVNVYFPGPSDQQWVDMRTLESYNSGKSYDIAVTIDAIPVFYRDGGLVPTKEILRPNSVEMINDPVAIYAVLNQFNTSHGTLYLDDYTSFQYRDNKEYNYVNLDVSDDEVTVTQIDDDASSDQFEFTLGNIYLIYRAEQSEEGLPGKYVKVVHKEDADGNLFSDMKLNFRDSNKITLKLK